MPAGRLLPGLLPALLLVLLVLSAPARGGDGPPPLEAQIKAAYLYKFASYVDWPPAQGEQPLTIGVAGAEELAAELARLSQQYKVRNHAVEIRRVRAGDSLAGVQMLYVGQLDPAQSRHLLDSVAALPVLTVTDAAGAGVISFVAVDQRIRFEVSLARAESHGLKISARLLGVAYKIDGRSQ
jgi:hypothetical protein